MGITIRAVISLLEAHYGFKQLLLTSNSNNSMLDLYIFEITTLYFFIHFDKNNPNIILIGHQTQIKKTLDINHPKWQHLLITEVDKWIKQEELRELQREINGFTMGGY